MKFAWIHFPELGSLLNTEITLSRLCTANMKSRQWTIFSSSRSTHLFPPVMHHPFGVLEHFLPPQLKKVSRVRVELQPILSIFPIDTKITNNSMAVIKQGHHSECFLYLYGLSLLSGGGVSHARYASSIAFGIVSRDTTCWSKACVERNSLRWWMSCRDTEE